MRKIDAEAAPPHQRDRRWQTAANAFSWLGAAAAIGLGTLALLSSGAAEPLVLSLLVMLATVGVFFVFGVMSGFIRIADDALETELTRALAGDDTRGMQIIAADGTVAYANDALRRLFDQPQGPIPALPSLMSGEPQASECMFRLARAAERRESRAEEFPVFNASGPLASRKTLWLRVSVRPLRVGVKASLPRPVTLWQVDDITSDHQREVAAVGGLTTTLKTYDQMPAGFLAFGGDGRVLQVNVALAQWLGLSEDARTGGALALADLFTPDMANLVLTAGRTFSADAQWLDVDLLKSDGRAFAARLLIKGGGSIATATVIARVLDPATPDDRAAAEARFSRLFNSAPLGIATIDTAGAIVSFNAAFSRLFPEQAKRRRPSIQLLLASDAEARRAVETALERGAAGHQASAPVDFSFGPQREFTRRIYVSPLAASADPREVAILYVLDATEQKALEARYAQSQKMEAVGQLAGGIAHDFNNVLTAIIGFSDLLLGNQRPTDPAYRDIMNIKSSALRAAGLVRHLLAFSRRQTFQFEVLDLSEVLTDVSPLIKRSIGEKIELKVLPGRDLWSVKADKTEFERAIINLARNAHDAMMPAGGRLTIRTRNVTERDSQRLAGHSMTAREYVVVEVEDTGSGMSVEVMAKIFEPFFSTKDVGKGTGLGLSSVYGVVKQTGGYVFPESTVGKGTVFRIYLPRHVAEPGEEAAALRAARKKAEAPPRDLTGTGRILLVEDEDAVRSFAVRALARQGYEVLEATTGVEALEVVRRENGRIDLIVSDVVMPEMDGPTMLRELRKTHPDTKIVFVSGYPDDAFKKGLDEGETFAFLPKPFTLPELAAKVKEVLGK